MKTSRPFACISYNTDNFLKQTLDDLIKRNVITFYVFINHKKEDDELKDHKHLYIIPNGHQQTDGIRSLLEEPDPDNPLNKPLACLEFSPSKFDDWFLYACHDIVYLASKGQSRKHQYEESDFHSSSPESLHEKITTIDRAKYHKTQDFVDAVLRGVPFFELVKAGQVPAPQFIQWRNLYDFLVAEMTYRAGRETHSPCDPETGEVLETETIIP